VVNARCSRPKRHSIVSLLIQSSSRDLLSNFSVVAYIDYIAFSLAKSIGPELEWTDLVEG